MRKRLLFFVLVFCCLCVFSAAACAEQEPLPAEGIAPDELSYAEGGIGGLSFDEVQPALQLNSGSDSYAGLYNAWHDCLLDIAHGRRASTAFEFNGPDVFGSVRFEMADDLRNYVQNAMFSVLNRLTLDSFYELYWWNFGYYYYITPAQDAQGYYCQTLSVKLMVHDKYRYEGNEYAVDPALAQWVEAALANARSIVREFEGLPDASKLRAYKDRICELVDYDHNADLSCYSFQQILYVFDGDDTTGVDCVGFSRAFLYLCRLSTFQRVTDVFMESGLISGNNHVWDMVCIDGKYYLVDVTICDTLSSKDELFLPGYTSMSGDKSYFIQYRYSKQTYTILNDKIHAYHGASLDYPWSQEPYWDLVLPDRMERICEEAFAATILYRVRVGDSTRVIEDRAFANSQVKAVYIPPQCTQISDTAFADNGWNFPIIFGIPGSYAETFAAEHNMAFRSVD